MKKKKKKKRKRKRKREETNDNSDNAYIVGLSLIGTIVVIIVISLIYDYCRKGSSSDFEVNQDFNKVSSLISTLI